MQKNSVPDWKVPAIAGYVVIVSTFLVLGGWSAFARLDSAITATGVVSAETNRKTVQHLEGGIVREIRVREGQHVQAGEVLFRLDLTQPKAGYELQRNQLDSAIAQEARLIAERDGQDQMAFPQELLDRADDPNVKRAIADQVAQFQERSGSLEGQVQILDAKIDQYRSEIEGLKQERSGTANQLKFVNEELVDVRYLFEKQLTQKSRLMALERERSRLEGLIGRSTADESKARNGIEEARLQIRQLRQKFQEDIANSMLETRQKINDLREKVRVAQDVLSRVDILSPSTGVAQNLRVFTTGGVVKAGEPMIDVVPSASATTGYGKPPAWYARGSQVLLISNAYPSDHCGEGRECLPRSPGRRTDQATVLPCSSRRGRNTIVRERSFVSWNARGRDFPHRRANGS
jgi:HlyD family secretion protein